MSGKADYTTREYVINCQSTSVGSTPVAAYVTVPFDGEIVESYVSTGAAISTADSTVTLAVLPAGVAANAVTVGTTLVILVAGSAAGKSYTAKHTSPRTVREGDTIRLTPAGANSVNVVGHFTLKIRR